MSGGSTATTNQCGLTELLIFLAAIITGTACSICSKTMMDLEGVGLNGEIQPFSKPLFQTLGMFLGMTFGLIMHSFVVAFSIPFPGYNHANSKNDNSNSGSTEYPTEKDGLLTDKKQQETNASSPSASLPLWMYFFLAIPSLFDLGATALCMVGLQYLDVSIYQLLRGSGIIFVALMKQHVLKDRLFNFQWFGVLLNVVSVIMVGSTAVLAETSSTTEAEEQRSLVGILLVLLGAFIQALQFVFEEKVM